VRGSTSLSLSLLLLRPPPRLVAASHLSAPRPRRPVGGFVRGEARRPHPADPSPRDRARRDRSALVQPFAGSPARCRRGQPPPGSRARAAPLRLAPPPAPANPPP